MQLNQIYNMHALAFLETVAENSIDCCITSPPYWGLRDYGVEGQLGLEKTPEEFIANLVAVFSQVKRVLKPEGTCWVNMGDSYANNGQCRNEQQATRGSTLQGGKKSQVAARNRPSKITSGLKNKDLVGIPWMLAFALRADGWYLRQDIIWSKPNPMPESVTDRCTKSHEYIFMFTKSAKYYYDSAAIRTTSVPQVGRASTFEQSGPVSSHVIPKKSYAQHRPDRKDKQRGHGRRHAGFNERWDAMDKEEQEAGGANKRSVWEVATKPFAEAHFATFPLDLIKPCVLAGCPENGIILDPFMGAGTTALAALTFHRQYVGCELNAEYIKIIDKRLAPLKQQHKLIFA